MGIDIYARWNGQTEEEEKAQYTGFSVNGGKVGYLREAYHGGPYVTHYLLKEAFDSDTCEAEIPAVTLRKRLPAAVYLSIVRERKIYGGDKNPAEINLSDKGGEAELTKSKDFMDVINQAISGSDRKNDAVANMIVESVMSNEDQMRALEALIKLEALPDVALSFVKFVELCEKKEAELHKPCSIYASY